MDLPEFTTRVSALLDAASTLTLATGVANDVWACDLFYVANELNLVFFSDPASQHSRNLRAGGRCAATIHAGDSDWRRIQGVQLRGDARALENPADRARARASYVAKFPFARALLAGVGGGGATTARSVPYIVEPTFLRYIDNRLGLGTRYCVRLRDGAVVSGPDRE